MDEDPRQTAYRAHRRAWAAATGAPYRGDADAAAEPPAPADDAPPAAEGVPRGNLDVDRAKC